MGYTRINNPLPTSKQNVAIQGWGYGVRFNLPEDFFASFQVAYKIDSREQADSPNLYIDVGKKF